MGVIAAYRNVWVYMYLCVGGCVYGMGGGAVFANKVWKCTHHTFMPSR